MTLRMLDFTEREIKDIAISLLILSLVFAYPEILFRPGFFVFSLLTVGIAFIGHELSHRFAARRLGFYSEYVMWKEGLLMALLLAVITNGAFIFAAPGAVVFSGYWVFRRPEIDDIGKIGIAGVVFNTIMLYLFALSYFLTGIPLLSYAGQINGWFAIFNLFPFGPLDGRKVMQWNPKVWFLVFVLAAAGFGVLIFGG